MKARRAAATLPAKTFKTPKKGGRRSKDHSWRLRFCAALREFPSIRNACAAAVVSRATAYAHRARSAAFRAQWATALKEGVEKLEAVCWAKAMRRETTRTRTLVKDEAGRTVIHERVEAASDMLAIFLLKAHAPEKYRENFRARVSPRPVEAIKVETDVARLPDAELHRIISQATARGALGADSLAQAGDANTELAPDSGRPGNGAC
jgi:hypothetical protein